jgi:glucose-6-phosphate 1-dehydrogenase
LLILGASGDLTRRLLLPGLGGLLASGRARDLSLLGSATQQHNDDRWRERINKSFSSVEARGPEVSSVLRSARYLKADATNESDLRRLLDARDGRPILYFALPPQVTTEACRALAHIGLPEGARLVFEKPFGTSAASAQMLNDLVTRLVPEEQVYRVDHYLGMSTVLNILGLRFANRMIEPILNAEHVERVDIIFDECLALEGRAGYYDGAGALVDMIQSHALQVLSLFAMDPPSTLGARDLRDAKAQVLRATRVWNDDPVGSTRRGRYTAGWIDGRTVPSYADELGVDPQRGTETFAEVVLEVNTWRWAGIPFRVRAAKALRALQKAIIVTFRRPKCLPAGLTGYDQPDRLHIGMDPGLLGIQLNINGPGDPSGLEAVRLQTQTCPGDLPPYGELLAGVLAGDPTLFVRGETAVDCWSIIEPVQQAWKSNEVPLEEYRAGSVAPPRSRQHASTSLGQAPDRKDERHRGERRVKTVREAKSEAGKQRKGSRHRPVGHPVDRDAHGHRNAAKPAVE